MKTEGKKVYNRDKNDNWRKRKQQNAALRDFAKDLEEKQVPPDLEIDRIIKDNFLEIYEDL